MHLANCWMSGVGSQPLPRMNSRGAVHLVSDWRFELRIVGHEGWVMGSKSGFEDLWLRVQG